MSEKTSTRVLPLAIIGVVAIVAGAVAYALLNGGDDETAAQAEQARQLAVVQEDLSTSLALPLDFRKVNDFELVDANGETITQENLKGHWNLLFFGFTHCPDVCPITLQVLKNVVAKLEAEDKTPPQIVFVSVDPKRDTPEAMKRYIDFFNEDFIGITGEQTEIHAMTSHLGIVYSFTANDEEPENYSVDHSASMLLVDPELRLRAKVSPPLEVDNIINDYLTVVGAPS